MNQSKTCIPALLIPLFLFAAGLSAPAADSAPPVEIRNHWPVGAALLYVAKSEEPVRKGAAVAVLDPAPLIAELKRVETLLGSCQAEEQTEQLANSADPAETARKTAQEAEEAVHLFAVHDGPIGEITRQQSVTDTASAYDQELVRFNARDKLLNEGFIQKPEYELQGAKLQSARMAADLARAKLERFLKAEKPQKEAELKQKADQSKTALQNAEAKSGEIKRQFPGRIAALGKRIASLQAAVSSCKEQLALGCILAPVSGVFRLRADESAPPISTGSLIGPGEPIGNIQP